jgi:hypothetical protein
MSLLERLKQILGTTNYPLVPVQSTVDGKTYNVRDMPDKQKAANLMATLRMKLVRLCDALEKKYPDKPQVKLMVKNFRSDPERFIEATPDSEHTSSTVNKGESIHMCLRQRDGTDESLVDENVMMFVALHEFAHVCTKSVGHDPEFWNNFGWLLREAEAIEIYRYQDFRAHPVTYCGEKITDQPKYDASQDAQNEMGNPLKIGNVG